MAYLALNRSVRILIMAAAITFTSKVIADEMPYSDSELPRIFAGNRAIAGYRTVATLSGEQQTVDVFAVPNVAARLRNGRPSIDYVARRVVRTAAAEETVSWATSQDCPALYNTLVWMTALVAPNIELPGVTPSEFSPEGRRPLTTYADGLDTSIWGQGTQPDHTQNSHVQMSSNGGLIAEFGRAANANLASCWRDVEPPF